MVFSKMFRKRPLTWREEVALDNKREKIRLRKERKKKEKEETKRLKREAKAERKKVVIKPPKVGRNGMTWAEKEAGKKLLDSKHLEKFERLHSNKPKRSTLDHESWSGYVHIRSRSTFFPWKKRFILIQGHFLYIFRRDRPNSKCRRALLLKKADLELIGMRDGRYYIVVIKPKTPKRPYVDKIHPPKSLLDGSIQVSCVNKKVQEGLGKEIKKCSKVRQAGRKPEKHLGDPILDLASASTGGLKTEKHVIKWRKMNKNPPTLAQLGLVDKQGWLERQGTVRKPWVKRYIVVKGHWLYEFKATMPSSKCQRIVFLGNCKVVNNKFANNGFIIKSLFQRNPDKIGSEDKSYGIQCGTLIARREWEGLITSHASMKHAGRTKRAPKEKEEDKELSNVVSLFHYSI